MIKKWMVYSMLLPFFLIGCQPDHTEVSNNIETHSNLPTLRVIADSEQALALFRMEEQRIQNQFGVKLDYYYPDRMNDNLEDFLFASGEVYDIYVLFPAKIPEYVERDMLMPLESFMQGVPSFNDIIPIYRKLYMNYDNHDYAVVYDGDAHLLFYRKDLFEKYSDEYQQNYGEPLSPPKTWDEYDRIAKFLTRDTDGDGKIDIYGTATFAGDAKRYVWFSERFLSMGGQYFDENMRPTIQSKEGVKAINDWIQLRKSGATPPEAMYDWIDLNNAFLQGQLAMVVQWSDTARFSYDTETWNSQVQNKVSWSLVPGDTPTSPKGGVWIGRTLGISKETKYPKKAWEVIHYLTSEEVSSRAVTSLNTINDPFRTVHFNAEKKVAFPDVKTNQDFLNTLKDSLKNTNADLMIPGGWKYMQVLDQHLGLALIGVESPEEVLEKTATEWEKITDHYGRESQKEYYKKWQQKLKEVRQHDLE